MMSRPSAGASWHESGYADVDASPTRVPRQRPGDAYVPYRDRYPGNSAYPRGSRFDSRRDAGRHSRQVQQRRQQRGGPGILVLLLVLASMIAGFEAVRRGVFTDDSGASAVPLALAPTLRAPTVAAPPVAEPQAAAPPLALAGEYPRSGPGTWIYAASKGPVLGSAGNTRLFKVAIETGINEDMTAFATLLDQTLGDPRSWVGGRGYRLQRVPPSSNAEFAIYLATPETARKMCAEAGVDIRENGVPYTSCRTFGRVILNLSRWRESVPDYVNAKIYLDDYRRYVINHEVGHQLGFNHERCPGPGHVAPVMQTQTLGLRGCVANAWPYIDSHRYTGPPE